MCQSEFEKSELYENDVEGYNYRHLVGYIMYTGGGGGYGTPCISNTGLSSKKRGALNNI